MKITRATIVTGRGSDRVYLHTDLPPATWPYNESPTFDFDVAAGNGVQYVRDNFTNEFKLVSINAS